MAKNFGWVALEGAELKAFHGVYDKERQEGGTFIVDLKVRGDLFPAATSDSIKSAINYEVLAQVVEQEMQIQSQLLEHVAYRILCKTLEQLPETSQARIKITKKSPPVDLECWGTSVSMKLSRKDLKKYK